MSSWLHEYSSALDVRDAHEQANASLLQSYCTIADRLAELETAAATSAPTADPQPPTPPSTRSPKPTAVSKTSTAQGVGDGDATRLRSDLAASLRTRQTLQSQLATAASTVTALRSQLGARDTRLAQLARAKELLERKVKDRDEEVKGKGRLATDAQDEMVALQLQLNMSEQKNEELRKENQMLVDRWLKEMGQRVDKMNVESKWE